MTSPHINIGYLLGHFERHPDSECEKRLLEIYEYLKAVESCMIDMGHLSELEDIRRKFQS